MQDQLIVITKMKKTILFLEKFLINFPLKETVLKQKIETASYAMLELAYFANTFQENRTKYQKEILVKLKMLDFYMSMLYEKKIISPKKYHQLGEFLLDITKLVQGWIKYTLQNNLESKELRKQTL